MTSRERTLESISHREPDKVPIDMNATIVTSLTRIPYQKLRLLHGFEEDPEPEVSHFAMDTVRARDDLLDCYDVDTRSIALNPPDKGKDEHLPDGTYRDEYGHVWKRASYYWDVVSHPFENLSRDEAASAMWPDEHDPGRYRGLKERAQYLKENTDKCLVFDIPGLGPFEGGCFLRGHGNFCADLHADPAYAEYVLDRVTDSMILIWGHLLDEVGEYVDVVAQGDDVGMQNSPFMSVDMYRKFVKPRKKKMFDFIHSKTKAKVFYHSCGSVYDYIPDFIEEGVDILNPIQRSAANMDIAVLKREFGKDLAFWGGGIDVQQELPFLSLDEIEDEIKRTIDIMAPGGGFVFFPSHNVQADVTPDRIDRVFNSVLKYRDY
jgi:uroporphyrinogen decarboxylase